MFASSYTKTGNGYYWWSHVTKKCKKCYNIKQLSLKCQTSTETKSTFRDMYSTFEGKIDLSET